MSHRQWLLCPLVAAGALALLAGVPSTRSEQGEPSRKAPAAEPITVFEGSSYAGDARVADLQPNEERLLSYAVDLGTEVKPEAAADSGRLTHLKAVKGVLYTTTKLRETKTYAVKSRNPQGRAVLIGHPVKDQSQLVDNTMLVQAGRDAYRFEV